MTKMKSELELTCPCCHRPVVDTNLDSIVSHSEPERSDKTELTSLAILPPKRPGASAVERRSKRRKRGDACRGVRRALKRRARTSHKAARDFDWIDLRPTCKPSRCRGALSTVDGGGPKTRTISAIQVAKLRWH